MLAVLLILKKKCGISGGILPISHASARIREVNIKKKYLTASKLIQDAISRKKCDIDLDKILSIDFKRRTLIQEVESLKADRNTINKIKSELSTSSKVDLKEATRLCGKSLIKPTVSVTNIF